MTLLGQHFLFTGKIQQVADDPLAPMGRIDDHLEILPLGAVVPGFSVEGLRVQHDCAQGVVDLVGDPGGQLTHGGQFFLVDQFLLDPVERLHHGVEGMAQLRQFPFSGDVHPNAHIPLGKTAIGLHQDVDRLDEQPCDRHGDQSRQKNADEGNQNDPVVEIVNQGQKRRFPGAHVEAAHHAAPAVREGIIAGDKPLVHHIGATDINATFGQNDIADRLRNPGAHGAFSLLGHHVGGHTQVAEKDGDRVDPRHLLDAVHQSEIVVEQIDRQDRADDPLIGVAQGIDSGQSETGRPFSGIKRLRCGQRRLDQGNECLPIQTDLGQKLLRYDLCGGLRLACLQNLLNDRQRFPFALRKRGTKVPVWVRTRPTTVRPFSSRMAMRCVPPEGEDGDFVGNLLVDHPYGFRCRLGRRPADL